MSSDALPDITATPAANQHLLHDGKEYTTIKEGLAHILIPASAAKVPQTTPKGENQPQSVFYNPIQQFNRDLSVLAIKAYGEEVVERKKKNSQKTRQKFAAKRKEQKEKKRKRGEDGVGEAPRKAGKIDDGAKSIKSEATNTEDGGAQTAVGESHSILEDAQDTAAKKPSIGGPAQTTPKEPIPQNPTNAESNEQPPQEAIDSVSTKPNAKTPSPPQPSFTILDALSATGLRALRYIQEIPFTTIVTANDLFPDATKTIQMNVKHNRLEDKIEAVTGNALAHMYGVAHGEPGKDSKDHHRPKYDVIDLDPYGTAAPFLDAAVQSVREDGGLLCVTCTDAGVWASNGYPEKAFSLYGGVPIKGNQSHEGGLRLILHSIATSAARYGLAMEPLLSLSIDFYARVFVKIHKSPADVKFLAGKTMVVYNCDQGCGAWTTQMIAKNKLAPNKSGKGHFWKHVFQMGPTTSENCSHCGMKTHLAGPMYAGPLHSPSFVKKILDGLPALSKDTYQTYERIEGMLTVALEETLPPADENSNSPTATAKTGSYDPAAIDHFPFFFIPSSLAKVIHCVTPHENALRGALRHLGYRVTRSHTKGGTIKTDAPWDVIWEVMREWEKQKAPIKEGAVRKDTAGFRILKLGEAKATPGKENGDANGDGTVSAQGEHDPSKTEVKLDVVFNETLGKEKDAKKIVRYQLNPRENWGPMNRAKGPA
ncbi:tRNA (guanine(26)-N(2))-dimethyltransferase [Lachnellula suecica]|uniref:tRNA (guanine(26)-N(2))-dimethyltransferase n=1 Tax=Lachnellula suecica TaxID=602035 RepID=A0A8T9C681_9HELO|nr:tRNA (guanine(26)-N(2))-dimethyltransferase [Lachnellula suecica]